MKKLTAKTNSNSGENTKNEPESDPSPLESDFSSLDLGEEILKWLNHKNFKRMTKVQSLCLKQFLKRENDVLVQSCTGSGKTLCFLIPILNSFLHDTNFEFEHLLDVFSLIILPTRELSIQIFDIITDFLKFTHCHTTSTSDSANNSVDISVNNSDKSLRNVYRIMEKNVYNILLIGGTSVEVELRNMKKACEKTFVKSLVVGTPGRLRHVMDLLSHEFVWTFRNLRFLILDEADRLLEMGFQNDLSNILTHLPKQRQTGLFSATLNTGIQNLSKLCLHNHIHINTDSTDGINTVDSVSLINSVTGDSVNKTYTIPKGLNNYYLILSMEEKLSFVLAFLEYLKGTNSTKIVIFFLSCDLVNYFHHILSNLMRNGGTSSGSTDDSTNTNTTVRTMNILKIHRKMTSKKRNKSINMFKSGTTDSINVLLCTDVFSRGIDVPGIDWILQFDPPQDPNFYLHRIGRAGRAETPGNALLLLTETEESYIQFQHNRKITLQPLPSNLLNSVKNMPNSVNPTGLPYGQGSTVELDTKVEGDRSYLSYLMENPVEKPVLLWAKTALILSYLRLLNSRDRELLLLSSRAFVSYTRAYSEHSLKYIFEKQKLDYGALATSLGVLRIPRVKEILGRKIEHFVQSTINPKDVPYLDPEKEADRLKQIEQLNNSELRSDKPSKLDKNKLKKQNKDNSKGKEKVKRTRTMKREAKRRIEFDEWNEFRKEEALVKKLKKKGFNQKDIENLNNDECEFGEDLELEVESSKRWILRGKKRNKRKKH
ncbi:DEAD/DEAH box helicase family protein [Theileria parva strain Muguga]|uniref:DEAD/DEAH box helicase family protein n=1 Tax=Theileria parva strain Muguga TaxID=333668 RepID=UPI001C61B966|nr:DEAD/DEAH box helicase family protein [Theileria parva strain Muguga]EAN32714.2 DEAD/DEAH box helicase family protein [Theileria parva strain Muguga]